MTESFVEFNTISPAVAYGIRDTLHNMIMHGDDHLAALKALKWGASKIAGAMQHCQSASNFDP